MRSSNLPTLRFFSLLFLLPGLAGLILAAVLSAHYLDTLPRLPDPEDSRIVPRSIHGIVVYQTEEEDRRMNLLEGSAVGVFIIGMVLGVVYLEKWSAARGKAEEEENIAEERS